MTLSQGGSTSGIARTRKHERAQGRHQGRGGSKSNKSGKNLSVGNATAVFAGFEYATLKVQFCHIVEGDLCCIWIDWSCLQPLYSMTSFQLMPRDSLMLGMLVPLNFFTLPWLRGSTSQTSESTYGLLCNLKQSFSHHKLVFVQGRRILLSPDQLPKKTTSLKPLPCLLQSHLPLTIEVSKPTQILQKASPAASEPNDTPEQAQLMRIWVSTPSKPLEFAMHPKVLIEVNC